MKTIIKLLGVYYVISGFALKTKTIEKAASDLPPLVVFEKLSIHLTDSAKIYLDTIYSWIAKYPTDTTEIIGIDLVNHSCIWENIDNPYIGVQRAQNIIDYLERKGVNRDICYIRDIRYLSMEFRDSVIANTPVEQQMCDPPFFGIFVIIKTDYR